MTGQRILVSGAFSRLKRDNLHFFFDVALLWYFFSPVLLELSKVPQSEMDYISEHIVQMSNFNEYQDYFEYARRSIVISLQNNRQQAGRLNRKLITLSENGVYAGSIRFN